MISAYSTVYKLFCGTLRLSADERGITGISFIDEGETVESQPIPTPVAAHLHAACEWLEAYQASKQPDGIRYKEVLPEVRLHIGGSPFQRAVWEETMKIPFGETMTYGELARRVALSLGKERMSAQAVGGALKRNPVVLLVPCHRVTGAGGQLGGYIGKAGTALKQLLLAHEGVYII